MGKDKANMVFRVPGFHQLTRPKLGNYFSEVFCDVYLPLIKSATTAAGLMICCITLEEKISLLCFFHLYFAIAELSTLVLTRIQQWITARKKNCYNSNCRNTSENCLSHKFCFFQYYPELRKSPQGRKLLCHIGGFLTNCHFFSKAYLFSTMQRSF